MFQQYRLSRSLFRPRLPVGVSSVPQINLALLFGEQSRLPFYYRKLAGNIPAVKTVQELIKELNILGYAKITLVMDRGFYNAISFG